LPTPGSLFSRLEDNDPNFDPKLPLDTLDLDREELTSARSPEVIEVTLLEGDGIYTY
jgi:hypothetical protein